MNKFQEITLCLEELIEEFQPDYVIYEAVFTRFKKASSVLYFLQGFMFQLFQQHQIEVFTLSNRVAKKTVNSTTKEEAFSSVSDLLKLKLNFKDFNDEVDAILLGYAFLLEGKKILKKIK